MEVQDQPKRRISGLAVALIVLLAIPLLSIGGYGAISLLSSTSYSFDQPPRGGEKIEPIQRQHASLAAGLSNPISGSWVGDAPGAASLGTVTLEIQESGGFAFDGCNWASGRWILDKSNTTVEISNLAATRKGCIKIESWLFDASYGKLTTDQASIEFFNDSDESIGFLHRAEKHEWLTKPWRI